MEYKVEEIRESILKLEEGSNQGFCIEIPEGGEIIFYRHEDKILIRNKNNIEFGEIYFKRENLVSASTEEENNKAFSSFLENVRANHLDKLGL